MIGNAPAAETSGGIGVGPGDMRRYLFIMVWGVPLLLRTTRYTIVAMMPADNYIVAQTANKVLLAPPGGRPFCILPGVEGAPVAPAGPGRPPATATPNAAAGGRHRDPRR